MFVWWPGLDHDIKQEVKGCHECQNCLPNPRLAPLIPFKGQMFLVVIGAHSKWLEVHPMPMITAQATFTIQRLRTIFAQFGILESCVGQWTKLYQMGI